MHPSMIQTSSDSVTSNLVILLEVGVNPTTNRLNVLIHHVIDCSEVNVTIEIRLIVADVTNHCLISSRIDSQRLNRGGLDVSDLKEHVSVNVSG